MTPYSYYLLLLAFGLSLLVHFLVIDVSLKKGIFLDSLEKIQKSHVLPTPRIGGLGIFLASMLIIYDTEIGTGLMLASIPAFIAGFMEDYSGKIAPLQRLAIMLLSPILCIIILGPSIIVQIGGLPIPSIVATLITIVFSLAMINGVNFIDGQNGLAAGTIFISQLGCLMTSIILNDVNMLYICAIIAIGTFTFLFFNYPKAKIFLGDGGAYFLGFITAIVGICIYTRHTQEISLLLIPTLLIYPLWEVSFSTLRKIFFEKLSPLQSDKYHLHQLVFRNQGKGKQYIPALYLLPMQILTSILALALMNNTWALLLIMIVYVLTYTLLYVYSRRMDTLRRIALVNKKGPYPYT